jgi:hypothetical protein
VKKKDLTYLLLAVGILLVAGYLGYTQLAPKKTGPVTVEVEKIGAIPSEMDSDGLARIGDTDKVIDYNSPVDLTGLGNRAPFGP